MKPLKTMKQIHSTKFYCLDYYLNFAEHFLNLKVIKKQNHSEQFERT